MSVRLGPRASPIPDETLRRHPGEPGELRDHVRLVEVAEATGDVGPRLSGSVEDVLEERFPPRDAEESFRSHADSTPEPAREALPGEARSAGQRLDSHGRAHRSRL